MEKNNIPEEVTITPVIKDIERLVNRLFFFFLSIVKYIGKSLKYFFLNSFRNRKTLGIVTIIGAMLGFMSVWVSPRQYSSSLVVDFYVDAKIQLYADVVYFNTLITRQKHEKLAEIFNINVEEAKTISSFKLAPYYSYIDNVKKLNNFHNELDTSIIKFVDFQTLFEEEENPELGNRYVITIYSSDVDLFSKMEQPLVKFLERSPEIQKLRLTNIASLTRKKKLHEEELVKLDALIKVLNEVMVEQSKQNLSSSNKGTYISLGNEADNVNNLNQLEVQKRYTDHSESIIEIENELTHFDTCYSIVSHINETGTKSGFGKLGRAFIFGLIAFFIGLLFLSCKALYLKTKHAGN